VRDTADDDHPQPEETAGQRVRVHAEQDPGAETRSQARVLLGVHEEMRGQDPHGAEERQVREGQVVRADGAQARVRRAQKTARREEDGCVMSSQTPGGVSRSTANFRIHNTRVCSPTPHIVSTRIVFPYTYIVCILYTVMICRQHTMSAVQCY